MEINSKNALVALNPNVQRLDAQQQSQRPQKTAEESSSPNLDRIELSTRSREIQHIEELIRSTPDIREARVEQIRSAIQGGTYNVKAEQIADKILGGNVIDEIL